MDDDERRHRVQLLDASTFAARFSEFIHEPETARWAGELGGRGLALEAFFVSAFEREEHNVIWPCRTRGPAGTGTLEQIDGVLYLDFATFLVEAKAEKAPIDVEPLAKLRFRLEGRPPSTLGLLVNTSGFTKPAEFFARFASPLNVLLWTEQDLLHALTNKSFYKSAYLKWQAAVAKREALFDLKTQRGLAFGSERRA